MKNILIPVDFSEISWNAIRCVQSFFKNIAVTFHVIHIDIPSNDLEENTGELVLHKNIASHYQLEEWTQLLDKKKSKHHTISSIEKTGSFIRSLKETVHQKNIDLIVMGTEQANVLKDTTIGSYTREVITRIQCPTIIVPQDVPCPKLKQVALVTDFNFQHNSKALETISQIITIADAHLTILNLVKQEGYTDTNQKENKSFLKSAFSDLEHSFHFVVNQTMDEALQFFINVHEVDLVILFAKNMNFSEHLLFSPSTDTSINYHKRTPFLIVHE
ncbi:universal stress protein [Dokdonia pacifica]|uniref:Nucleotide-binding universal stress protein, UspA family n=1 Tax=Dokdonia pacifica TaxID=1627892 RepID=A0A239BHS6_9FLAO|nr:universal stress protein [Dokdonia pacifica]GGG29508.1 universal stress protein [Dokdonia pacifica]SNS07122.1 Nucleotide-binding universal stress protein, UspA family [Dokdonia pacifica]